MTSDAYLDPRCGPRSLDRYGRRHSILREIRRWLPHISGKVLDVGCGSAPYRDLIGRANGVTEYVGVDIDNPLYSKPDLVWDGKLLPLPDLSYDVVICTEVLEHCPDPVLVLREIRRVLKSGGIILVTVPFLWPLHDTPNDHYRYTPFPLDRMFNDAGFTAIEIRALGGWDRTLAEMIGLWVRRRPMHRVIRMMLSVLLTPPLWLLHRTDRAPQDLSDGTMANSWSLVARKVGHATPAIVTM